MNIKKFENFNSKTFNTLSTISELTNYYLCDDCNAMWRSELNATLENRCRFCGKYNINNIDSDDWFDEVALRLDSDELPLNEEDREKSRTLVDLVSLDKYIDSRKKGFNIN